MSPVTPKLRQLARRLMALEAARAQPAEATDIPGFRVCAKLRRYLTRLAGVAGFRALLARALVLAKEEVDWLGSIQVDADGTLAGLLEVQARPSQPELVQGEIVLVSHLINLLVTFIGEALTLRLVHEAWPEVPPDDLKLSKPPRS